MKSYKKCIFALTFASLMVPMFLSAEEKSKHIVSFLWTDESRYIASNKGVIDELKEAGFKEPDTTYSMEVANGNKITALNIARKLVQGKKADIIFTFGTSATVLLSKEITEIPVVFGTVFDPVAVKIAKSWESSGNNFTGVSSMVPMTTLVKTMMTLKKIKRPGVFYTPGELNSEAQLKELLDLQKEYSITIVPIPIKRKEEASSIIYLVPQQAEAVYVSGSGVVGQVIPEIIERMKDFDIILNKKAVAAAKIDAPPAFLKEVTKTID